MSNHILNSLTGGLQILTGIEVIRMLCEVLTDVTGHGKTDIGVDIDLTYGKLSCLTELLFRNTYGVRHVAAVLVNHLNEFLRNGAGTVKNDRETGQSLDALFEYVETERRGNKDAVSISRALCSRELVCAVRGSDSDCKGVTSGSCNEFLNLFRTGVAFLTGLNNNLILNTCEGTELSLNYNAVSMCILNNLLGKSNVLIEGLAGSVDHNGSETAVDAGLTKFKAVTMVKVKSDRNLRILDNGSLNEFYKVGVVCIRACTLGYLKDDRAVQLACSLSDTLNDFHVVYVKSTDSVAAVISFRKHFFCGN